MTKSFYLSEDVWATIRQHIINEHGTTILLLRDRCRAELGFTVRHEDIYSTRLYTKRIWLDFFDEMEQTMFLLKYAEYINKSET